LFEVAFNFRCLNLVQLAINVRVNDFQYFLTTQLGTLHAIPFSITPEKRSTASFTVVK